MPWKTAFRQLDSFLQTHQSLWRPQPFVQLQLPWETEYPELGHWLRSRPLEAADLSQAELSELAAPAPYPDWAGEAARLSAMPELPIPAAATNLTPALNRDVPGRKWQQIEAFAARLQFSAPVSRWLDWCAGKAFLGRALAHRDQLPLSSLEWNADLVRMAEQLSQRHGIRASHHCADVLSPSAADLLHPGQTPVALHACGDLHVRLLEAGSRNGLQQLAVAPCCYNRTRDPQYRKLSRTAQQSSLQLSRDDLTLIQREAVTAGQRQRRLRDRNMAWRLGFDLLQRQLRGTDNYLPVPSFPDQWLQLPYGEFCQALARLKNLDPLPPQDWPALEARGWERLRQVRNLELVRAVFRRPLEVWVFLDRVLYLEDQGYQVRAGTFCHPELTPRNLLLLAERNP